MRMNHELTLKSVAKINLGLHINSSRDDGYHNIQTIFQLLDLHDTMTFVPNNKTRIELVNNKFLEDNLILKAANSLVSYVYAHLPSKLPNTRIGLDILLNKNIPVGGGLGGGSSNAATTLIALNYVWDLDLTLDILMDIGKSIGADVPIFIYGHNAFAIHRGDKFYSIEFTQHKFIIIKPSCSVITAKIFRDPSLKKNTPAMPVAQESDLSSSTQKMLATMHNDCLSTVIKHYPEVDLAMKYLQKFTDSYLTGTGACVFAIIDNNYALEKDIVSNMPSEYTYFIANSIKISPLHSLITDVSYGYSTHTFK